MAGPQLSCTDLSAILERELSSKEAVFRYEERESTYCGTLSPNQFASKSFLEYKSAEPHLAMGLGLRT